MFSFVTLTIIFLSAVAAFGLYTGIVELLDSRKAFREWSLGQAHIEIP